MCRYLESNCGGGSGLCQAGGAVGSSAAFRVPDMLRQRRSVIQEAVTCMVQGALMPETYFLIYLGLLNAGSRCQSDLDFDKEKRDVSCCNFYFGLQRHRREVPICPQPAIRRKAATRSMLRSMMRSKCYPSALAAASTASSSSPPAVDPWQEIKEAALAIVQELHQPGTRLPFLHDWLSRARSVS